jgi:hypothetical protein
MIFIKEQNGNILLQDGADTVAMWPDAPTQLQLNSTGDAVIISQAGFEPFGVFAVDVTGYQVLPAAVVPFAGTAPQLIDVLKSYFFLFDQCCDGPGGGGGGGFDVGNWIFIDAKTDFPPAIAGVITLEADKTYVITRDLDLTGDALQLSAGTTLLGGGNETVLSSTGLLTALLISTESVQIFNLGFDCAVFCDFNGGAMPNGKLVSMIGCRVSNTTTTGTIQNYTNVLGTNCSFANCGALTFNGTISSIGFLQSSFDCRAASTMINVPSTATISTRIRFNICVFICLPGETGINISTSATIPTEGYYLGMVNFTGGGTYTAGVQYSDNKAFFSECRGVGNSGAICQYTMFNNATATTVAAANTFYKAAGTTTPGIYVEKFNTATTNRGLYTGALTGYFKVTATLTMSSGNNRLLSARVAKNGTTTAQSETSVTTDGAGRVENVTIQDIVSLSINDYIEVFVANESAIDNITVQNLSVIIERLN